MGRFVCILVLAAVILSCSKENGGGVDGPNQESGVGMAFAPALLWPDYNVSNSSQTRASNSLVNDSDDLKSSNILLLATASRGSDILPVFNNQPLSFTDGAWSYAPIKYWFPRLKYTFGAFWPSTLSNSSITSTGTDDAPILQITDYITGKTNSFDARSEDLLYASYTRDNTYTSDYSAVPLQFNHLLACVSFHIRNTTDTDIIHIKGIELVGHQYMCDINVGISSAVLTPDSDDVVDSVEENYFDGEDRVGTTESPFLPKAMTEEQFEPLFDCENLTVLPQTVFGKGVQLKFTIYYEDADPVVYTGNLSSIESIPAWEQGKKYRYNITISSENIYFQLVEVPWIEHEIEL